MNWPTPHHGMVSEYQSSGVPFVTSSATNEVGATPISVTFPFVTRWIQVFNTDSTAGDTLRIGFTQNGVSAVQTANYMILSGGQSTARLELKCDQLWFLKHGANPASFSVIAGLTNVPPDRFFVMSGSSGVEGVG